MGDTSILQQLEQQSLKNRREGLNANGKKHWKSERTVNGEDEDIYWLYLDKEGSKANTLGEEVLEELDQTLAELEGQLPKALVITSNKRRGFCAGADIEQFRENESEQITALLQEGHRILGRLENFPAMTIAVIHGHCLGGGLELALACDKRIGIKGVLQMGFPEVKLGLHPGLGGTYRLTHLIDPVQAMTMMLTGNLSYGKQTKALGLIDELVEERHVVSAVRAALSGDVSSHQQSLKDTAVNSLAGRKVAAQRMRSKVEEQAPKEYYPAPYALIDLWVENGGDPKAMQKGEINSFSKLVTTKTSKNLVRTFFLRQSLKSAGKKDSNISHVHIVGAGTMGRDIAVWCAMKGYRVTLSDEEQEPIAKALQSIEALCAEEHRSSIETRDTLDRLTPDIKGYGLKHADLVIEAVPEKLEIKQDVYKQIEAESSSDTLLATNTSSIELSRLSQSLKRPQNLVGLHFFNPVSKMKLVEVIHYGETKKRVMDRAMGFVSEIDKLPVSVKSSPGFLVNRVLLPYLIEACLLLDEGTEKEVIDAAAKKFGMPMGPIELLDQIGLDVGLEVAEMLRQNLQATIAPLPDQVAELVEQEKLGKKKGEGFYKWEDGKPKKSNSVDTSNVTEELIDQLILPLLNACAECYRTEVITDLEKLDGAIIFATGFAPFRGGPMKYAEDRGKSEVKGRLQEFASNYGERFTPDPHWGQ